jgi:hypothetical protein
MFGHAYQVSAGGEIQMERVTMSNGELGLTSIKA